MTMRKGLGNRCMQTRSPEVRGQDSRNTDIPFEQKQITSRTHRPSSSSSIPSPSQLLSPTWASRPCLHHAVDCNKTLRGRPFSRASRWEILVDVTTHFDGSLNQCRLLEHSSGPTESRRRLLAAAAASVLSSGLRLPYPGVVRGSSLYRHPCHPPVRAPLGSPDKR